MIDCIIASVDKQSSMELIAKSSLIPVVNGTTSEENPLQMLSYVMTMLEYSTTETCKIACIGAYNNIMKSVLICMPKLGFDVSISTPTGYGCDSDAVNYARENAEKTNSTVTITTDPLEAIKDANYIILDSWLPNKFENESEFDDFKITKKLIEKSNPSENWKFIHSHPHTYQNIDGSIFYDNEHSVIYQDSENLKYVVLSVFLMVTGCYENEAETPST
jgi:ornithine carbamoyltransferase